jgi:hypothetical protein
MRNTFQPGNAFAHNGKQGRPPGTRNRLCKQVLDDLLADWAEGGPAAIKIMRIEKPAEYVRIMANLLPKELILQGGLTDMDDENLDDLLAALHQRLIEAREQAPLLLAPEKVEQLNGRGE